MTVCTGVCVLVHVINVAVVTGVGAAVCPVVMHEMCSQSMCL